MIVTLIAAIAESGVIGRDNDLPWRIKDDMRFFVRTTKGHTVITGRKNFDAMGKALPNRTNIVITRNPNLVFEGALSVPNVAVALQLAFEAGESEVFVIGGAQIYLAAFPYAHRFYRTRVLAQVQGDVFFPALDLKLWDTQELTTHPADAENEHPFVIERLDRRDAPANYQA